MFLKISFVAVHPPDSSRSIGKNLSPFGRGIKEGDFKEKSAIYNYFESINKRYMQIYFN
jgi:hypothetical protein